MSKIKKIQFFHKNTACASTDDRGDRAIVVAAYSQPLPKGKGDDIRRTILRAINPQLPLFSQLYDVEITDQPLARTEKQTIKRYLYR